MNKKCLCCSILFEAKGHKLYCSEACQRISKNERSKEKWKILKFKHITHPNLYQKAKECIFCSKRFIPNICHPLQKTCSPLCCRKLRYKLNKNIISKKSKERYEKIKHTIEYKKKAIKNQYNWRKKNLEKAKEINRRSKLKHREKILAKSRKYELKERICAFCNRSFMPDRNHPLAKCCSQKCRNELWTKHNLEKARMLNIEKSRRYRERHPDKIKELTRKLVESGKANENQKKWRRKYPEKAKEYDKRKHSRERERENKRRAQLGLPLIKEGYTAEKELGAILVKLISAKYLKHDRKTLKGLELDYYYPDLKLAFEYMGRQHYEESITSRRTIYYQTKEEFEKQKQRDNLKERQCKEIGIALIRIKYNEKLSEQLILQKLKYLNISITQNKLY